MPFPRRELLERRLESGLRTGDAEATLQAAWALYARRVYGYLRKAGLAPQDADDATSRVFVQVFEGLANFDHRSFEGWVFRLAWYQVRAWRTRRSREASRAAPEPSRAQTQDLVLMLDARQLLDRFAEELERTEALILFSACGDEELIARLEAGGTSMTRKQLWRRRHALRQRIEAALDREDL